MRPSRAGLGGGNPQGFSPPISGKRVARPLAGSVRGLQDRVGEEAVTAARLLIGSLRWTRAGHGKMIRLVAPDVGGGLRMARSARHSKDTRGGMTREAAIKKAEDGPRRGRGKGIRRAGPSALLVAARSLMAVS